MTGKIVSFVNFKGGVGKTTTSVNIAACLAKYHGKKVLLVDIDPQINATLSLISEEKFAKLRETNSTLIGLFNDIILYGKSKNFKIEDIILKNVVTDYSRNIKLLPNLDLLPSDLELAMIEYKLGGYNTKFAILSEELNKIRDKYDYIICDCPPNLYILTINALFASDYYIIPAIPDYLSSVGLELLITQVDRINNDLSKYRDHPLELKGVIFTKVQATNLHRTKMSEIKNRLKAANSSPFENYIRNLIAAQEAAEYHLPVSLYKPTSNVSLDYQDCAKEFLTRIP